mgnify:CR=1 FL=1
MPARPVEARGHAPAVLHVQLPPALKNSVVEAAGHAGMSVTGWVANVLRLAVRGELGIPEPPPPSRPLPTPAESLLAYLSGEAEKSPREEFFYVNDDGQVVAIRYGDWKTVFLENRGVAFEVWREPFTELRVPLLFNLRRDPFEKSQHNATVYNDWMLDHAFVAVPLQQIAGRFLMSMKEYPPSQTPGSFNLDKIQKQLQAAPVER